MPIKIAKFGQQHNTNLHPSKKVLMKRLLFILFCFNPLFNLFSQDYWKSYRQKEGLIDSTILDIAVGKKKVYIATEKGFSILDNDQFFNYNSANSSLERDRIKFVREFQDTVWVVADSIVTKYVNGRFQNFDQSNGLFNDSILDIEVNSQGHLAVATFSGVQLIRGSKVDTLSSRKCYNIAINAGDSIYANVEESYIVNFPGAPLSCEVYDGNTWSPVSDVSLRNVLNNAKLISLSNGRVGIVSSNEAAYLIQSTFSLKHYPLPSSPIRPSFLRDIDMGNNNQFWYALSSLNIFAQNSGGLYKRTATNLDLFLSGLPHSGVNRVVNKNGKVYIGTKNGLAIMDDSLDPFPLQMSLSTQDIKANFLYNGLAFSGRLGSNSGGLEFPVSSGRFPLYTMGLWNFGVSDLQDTSLAVQVYDAGDYTEGSINANEQAVRPSLFSIDRSIVNTHIQNYKTTGYTLPEEIAIWPAKGKEETGESHEMAPFVDVNSNGCYDPENGDYPYFLGDKAVYLIFNDAQQPRTGLFTPNFNLEVHLMAYVFNHSNIDYLNKSIFLKYTLINKSSRVFQMRSGFFQDFDIGNVTNDYMGSIPSSDIVYAYNSLSNDGSLSNSYGKEIPVVGAKLINHKLHSFGVFSFGVPSGSSSSVPTLPLHFIRAMESKWKDGIPYTQLGVGYDPGSTAFTNHLFPGDPKKPVEWSELNNGLQQSNTAGERSSLITVPPYEFKPGERKVIDMVIGVGIDSSNINQNWLDNIDELTTNLNQAAKFQQAVDSLSAEYVYSNCTVGLVESQKNNKSTNMVVYPNPSSGKLTILANQPLEKLELYDLQGKRVQSIVLSNRNTFTDVVLSKHLPDGLYIIQALTKKGKRLNSKILLKR